MLRQGILCCDIVGQVGKIFCRDRAFLCCDRVGQNREKLCLDRGLPSRDRDGHGRGVLSPRQSWARMHDKHARVSRMHAR